MNNIAILGDSHCQIYRKSNFNKYFTNCNIHYTDGEDITRNGKFIPYLMHTISNRGEIVLQHYLEKYKNYDYIMFVFGEPDIRIHFDKQIHKLNRHEDEVINTLTDNYITKLISMVPNNIKIIVRYILPQREISMINEIYAPNGNLNDRV